MKVLLALAGLVSVESAPTYFVQTQYAEADTNCSKAATGVKVFDADMFFAVAMVAMGAAPGVSCASLDGNYISITAAEGTCQMKMFSDKTCTTQTMSMNYNTAASKCEAKDEDGKKFQEVGACAATKPAGAQDLTCFNAADGAAFMTHSNKGSTPACVSTCTQTPSTCALLTSAFAGCASTCTAAEKQTVRLMVMFYGTLDCKCTAGAPPAATNGNQHMVPSLLILAMATVMSNMQ